MTAVSRPDQQDRLVAAEEVRAWDGATRLFHWALVTLIVSAFITRNYLNEPTLYLHRLNGYAILTLLLFRLLWGLFGSSTSRFRSFFPLPGPMIRYAMSLSRGRPLHYLGHNPVGAVLIFVMLAAVTAQACTGLFTSDDTIAEGPLHRHVSETFAARAASYHARGFLIIISLAALHITANLVYQFMLKDRLITSMVTGSKPRLDYVDEPQARLQPVSRAVICLFVAAAVVAGGVMAAGDSLFR